MELWIDTADRIEIEDAWQHRVERNITGLTTNAVLMRAAGVADYSKFVQDLAKYAEGGWDVSVPVTLHEQPYMFNQAVHLAQCCPRFLVKIPIYDVEGSSTIPDVMELLDADVRVNLTGVFELEIVKEIFKAAALRPKLSCSQDLVVSIFAGRMADMGCDPMALFATIWSWKQLDWEYWPRILWASAREVWNYYQAQQCADIITMSPALIRKYYASQGSTAKARSLETCAEFAKAAKGYKFQLP